MHNLLRLWNQVINAVSTLLTVITGLRENAILLLFVGRFADVRSRLRLGRISYDIARLDTQSRLALPDLTIVAETYDFHRAPTRTPTNLGEDRNVCLRVNSMTTTSLALHFDDAFGTNIRREQLFLFSISAPHCDVLNLDRDWLQSYCIGTRSGGNHTACYAYILDSFVELQQSRRDIHASVSDEFGIAGAPFLRCRERPMESFKYGTDLLVLQSFWGGGSYHVEIQSSVCWAKPVALKPHTNESFGLFQTQPADQQASVVMAVPPLHAALQGVAVAYAVITLTMVVRGVQALFTRRKEIVLYVPWRQRGHNHLTRILSAYSGFFLPPSKHVDDAAVWFSAGDALVGSDLWMNHWRYIFISILDSCVNVRTLYVVLEMGTWMLTKQVSFENFLFVCSALSRLTWLTCLAHTVLSYVLLTCIDVADAITAHWRISPCWKALCASLRWYVNAVALLCNFKLYSVLLLLQLYVLLLHFGSTTTMHHAEAPFKRPVYGGFADVAPLWRSEIACDVSVLIAVQLLVGHVLASLLLLTRLRHAVGNKLLAVLQRRYVFVGWDVFVAMNALGINPFPADGGRSTAVAHCSIAALTRQLHASGPSGWVRFAGDDAFTTSTEEGGSDRGELDHIKNVPVAPGDSTSKTTKWATRVVHVKPSPVAAQPHHGSVDDDAHAVRRRTSAKDIEPHTRVLTVHAESRWGPLVLMDEDGESSAVSEKPCPINLIAHNPIDKSDADACGDTRDALHALPRLIIASFSLPWPRVVELFLRGIFTGISALRGAAQAHAGRVCCRVTMQLILIAEEDPNHTVSIRTQLNRAICDLILSTDTLRCVLESLEFVKMSSILSK